MSNFSKAESVLELNKIKEMLAAVSPTEGAEKRALELEPETDADRVIYLQKLTTQAAGLMGERGMPSFYGVKDLLPYLDKGEKGGMMTPGELLDVLNLLRCASSLKGYFADRDGSRAEIGEFFSRLDGDKKLERRIGECIVSETLIDDNASPELSNVRRKIRTVNNRIRDNLKKYTTDGAYTKYLQENIVTMRNGRYVIPVRAECRGEIKGLLHDVSSSGQTVFIEPTAIVEANNELHLLSVEETKEIEKILYELTSLCLSCEEKLVLNYYNITELALHFAKAELSFSMMGVSPVINTKIKKIDLKNARHPLLPKDKVVPISVRLGGEFDTLVITGPNTGGKTVSLKTLGLFCLMAQLGLHIPADEGSSLSVFKSVFADIGDEQSIEQSLSTFSSHMKNIVEIVKRADKDSLCLFDELGAGTDPTEGAALAVAILKKIRSKGALCASTTHYAELKVFAIETEGVINGSCEFDVATLAPTYKLIIGAPGRSNAFAISEKLGLPEDIVEDARNNISSGEKKFENVISELEDQRVTMEKNREEAERIKADYEKKYREMEKTVERRLLEAEKALERAKAEAENIVASAKASAKYILDELNQLKKKQDSEDFKQSLDETRRLVKNEFAKLDEKLTEDKVIPPDEDYKLPRELRVGDEVHIVSMGKNGFIESLPDKKQKGKQKGTKDITVKIGIMSVKVDIKDLRLQEQEITFVDKAGKKKRAAEYIPSPIRSFSGEIDIRGEMGEDGWMKVDKFIDEAKIMGVNSIRVIHGKGTGALRNYIRAELKRDKRVKMFRQGDYGEGDSGVTVVELK